MNVPANLRYTASHEWVRTEADGTRHRSASPTTRRPRWAISSTSSCRRSAASLPAAEACAVVESVKAASDVYAPRRGRSRRGQHAGEPRRRSRSTRMPYAAWFFRLRPADAAARSAGLLDAEGVRGGDRRRVTMRHRASAGVQRPHRLWHRRHERLPIPRRVRTRSRCSSRPMRSSRATSARRPTTRRRCSRRSGTRRARR